MFTAKSNLSYESSRNRMIWMALTFQAGYINAGGFLACHRFVTHTTGFATFFGVSLAHGNQNEAIGMATVPVFFLLGTMLSAFFVDRRENLNLRPFYNHVFFLMSFFMGTVSIVGISGGFSIFGDEITTSQDYSLLALLCLTSGLQNAAITTAFGATVRTTHLTGITTDLGIGLVRVFSGSHGNSQPRENEIKANIMRISIILAFIFGSWIGAMAFTQFHYAGFLLPTLISTAIWLLSLFLSRHIPIENPFKKRNGVL